MLMIAGEKQNIGEYDMQQALYSGKSIIVAGKG